MTTGRHNIPNLLSHVFINLCNAYMVRNYKVNRDWCSSAYRNNDCCTFLGKRWGFLPLKPTNEKWSSPKPLLAIANKTAMQLNRLPLFLYVILKFYILFTFLYSLSVFFQKYGVILSQILTLLQMSWAKQARYSVSYNPSQFTTCKQRLVGGAIECVSFVEPTALSAMI